jgi:lipopolysaccharide transport system ATP-binding protein
MVGRDSPAIIPFMKPVVEVQNLSKLFHLGSIGATSLRDSMERLFGRKKASSGAEDARVAADRRGPVPNSFWGLKDVSFSVQAGEVVGIVGRNGAGKSTLLKILSRITEPTSGRAILRGRLASLLEVGTGFHPELTGRENIYLNGAILGMKRWEIAAKFDEIVEFAEVGQFLDTPVKRYSSGMFVRLAFAVAAHLEPEILFIDEVLAVGDAGFQKKCLGKMGDVANRQGRTVFFVSHNMSAIRALCKDAILIENGTVAYTGTPAEVISRYLAATVPEDASADGDINWTRHPDKQPGCADLRIERLRLLDHAGNTQTTFEAQHSIAVEITYRVNNPLRDLRFRLQLTTQEGELAFQATDHTFQRELHEPGLYTTTCIIPGGLLNRRMYALGIQSDLAGVRYLLHMTDFLNFLVSGAGNQSSHFPESWPGVTCPRMEWKTAALD